MENLVFLGLVTDKDCGTQQALMLPGFKMRLQKTKGGVTGATFVFFLDGISLYGVNTVGVLFGV